jgi:hypothetical protein
MPAEVKFGIGARRMGHISKEKVPTTEDYKKK